MREGNNGGMKNDDTAEFDRAVQEAQEIARAAQDAKIPSDDDGSQKVTSKMHKSIRGKRQSSERQSTADKKPIFRIIAAVGAVVAIALIIIVINSAKSPSIFERLIEPSSREMSYIVEGLNGGSFSVKADYTDSYGRDDDISLDYDSRVGDFAFCSTDKNNETNSAIYIRDNTIAKYNRDADTFMLCKTGVKSRSDITVNERLGDIFEKYLKQSGRSDMLSPYKKLIKSFDKKLTRLSGKEKLTLLGKEKGVKTEHYSCDGSDFAELLDNMLERFKAGDKLYDFVSLCCGEENSIEDVLDEIDDIRSEILRSNSQFTVIKYYKSGFLGIGKGEQVAERYLLSLNSQSSVDYELFVKCFEKGNQYEKEIRLSENRNGQSVRRAALWMRCMKIKGEYYSVEGSATLLDKNGNRKNVEMKGQAQYGKDKTALTVSAELNGFGSAYRASADVHIEDGKLLADASTVGSAGKSIKLSFVPGSANAAFPALTNQQDNCKLTELMDSTLSGSLSEKD